MSDQDLLPEDYKIIDHPMEDLLDIESGSTFLPATPSRSTELVQAEEFDSKDREIEEQFQEIYDSAMDAYEQQATDAEAIEPKYRARNQEVAVQYLNAALNAAKEKAGLKQFKDKLAAASKPQGPKTLNQNLIVADRNDLLKQILGNPPETD